MKYFPKHLIEVRLPFNGFTIQYCSMSDQWYQLNKEGRRIRILIYG